MTTRDQPGPEPRIPHETLRDLIFGGTRYRRFTQDSPVMPDVWFSYGSEPEALRDLLLTPHFDSSAAALTNALDARLGRTDAEAHLVHNESTVVARLRFEELIRAVLPLTPWWRDRVAPSLTALARRERGGGPMAADLGVRMKGRYADAHWLARVVGTILAGPGDDAGSGRRRAAAAVDRGVEVLRRLEGPSAPTTLWRVNLNREAATAISRSRLAVKADAVGRLFEVDCKDIRWAVIDSGIDATHPAFRRREANGRLRPLASGTRPADRTRIRATYDFRRLREIPKAPAVPDALASELAALRQDLRQGRNIDWDELAALLEVPHGAGYTRPSNEHGTHVAGILTADWRAGDAGRPKGQRDLIGMAPGLELYDLRVFEDDGTTDEFTVITALQFVRHLNARQDYTVVHGVNLSISIQHAVANYACGRTPVCDECDRLIGAGTVVVAAAGNYGYGRFEDRDGGTVEGFRALSITDPGNAERVITVGATHRYQAHTYGVSYFSSRGPTGDGRAKPDLVAPGEKIESPTPRGASMAMDGTSQAAPHVSGAAALLMARYPELIGDPERVKRVLVESCTDLGRERAFQGAGVLDCLRALQAV